jgi:hypothetical protein
MELMKNNELCSLIEHANIPATREEVRATFLLGVPCVLSALVPAKHLISPYCIIELEDPDKFDGNLFEN